MAKKHKKPPFKPAQKQTIAPVSQQKTAKTSMDSLDNPRKRMLYAAGVILITLILYIPSLFNDFIVNWDDGGYIQEHELVHKLNTENISKIFNPTTFYKGNYHPLTTFFYEVEYAMVGEHAFLYHLNNLLFHLLNVLLIFWLIRLLTKRMELAAFVALFFGIHPMHVESVAWISERKDVLYTFFFLLSCLTYYFYRTNEKNKNRNYVLAIAFFFLSLLSKSAAVALPGILLLMDYFQKRKFSWKFLLDKIPFLILSAAFGVLAVMSQSEKGAIQDLGPLYSPFERIFLVCNNIVMYLAKLFVPIKLGAMYPYPPRVDGHIPIFFYISGGIVLIIAALFFWSKKFGRQYIFGILFFLVSIALVIQALPVGGAIMAERYTYVPYIGVFLILGWMYTNVWKAKEGIWKKLKPLFHIIVIAFAIFFFILSWQRIALWKNGEVLFTDLIKTYPNLPFGYNNRGYMYYKWLKNNEKAEADFSKAISIDSTYYQALGNRGVLYYNTQRYEPAIIDFTKALKYKPNDDGSLIGRANTLSTIKRYAEALPDYDKYLKIMPGDAKAWMWRGTALFNTDKTDEAMKDFEKSHSLKMKVKPEERVAFEAEVIYWKALVFERKGDHQGALDLFNQSINLNPNRAETYGWRGITHYNLKHLPEAIADYSKAIELNPQDAPSFVNRATAYNDQGRFKEAFADLNSAGRLNYPLNKEFFFKVMALAGVK
jgi:protein O-mannosyl-transferase